MRYSPGIITRRWIMVGTINIRWRESVWLVWNLKYARYLWAQRLARKETFQINKTDDRTPKNLLLLFPLAINQCCKRWLRSLPRQLKTQFHELVLIFERSPSGSGASFSCYLFILISMCPFIPLIFPMKYPKTTSKSTNHKSRIRYNQFVMIFVCFKENTEPLTSASCLIV